MPELPEVETTRRGLESAILGKKIVKIAINRADLRQPIPETLAKTLKNRQFTAIRRRAKYLLMDLDSDKLVLAHLGMSGSFTVMPKNDYKPRTHDHIVIEFEDGLLAVFNDPRRFGVVDVLKKSEEGRHPLLAHLGPEPLSADFSPAYLKTQLLKRSGPIKPVLMDQKLVVGVGNIYASESLHLSHISPFLPAKEAVKHVEPLIVAIRATLEAAIASGGSTLRNYVGASGEGGYFQHHFLVYDRANEPCFSCATLIENSVQAGRATYWCPVCQPLQEKRRKH